MQTHTADSRGLVGIGMILLLISGPTGCQSPTGRHSATKTRTAQPTTRWHADLAYVAAVPPIVFHYDHGVLAGSYPDGVETVPIEFDDVCAQLGHVCLCGAGGFRIAAKAVAALRGDGPPLERDDFVLISSRDHPVSDVIAFVLDCPRRRNPERNRYLVDNSIQAPRREYHYDVAYLPTRSAVHVVYRKHLLIGHDAMDELWQIETAFESDPQSVPPADVQRYRTAMRAMVQDVLHDQVPGLITIQPIAYEDFEQRRDVLRRR